MSNCERRILGSKVPGIEKTYGFIPCFHCGLCCIGPRIPVTLREARCISEHMEIPWQEFEDNYTDPLWLGGDQFLLGKIRRACIFLKQEESIYKGICQIHPVRPFSCVSFTPSVFRRQCQMGLANYWGLTVSISGQLMGSDDKIQEFYGLCSSISEGFTE